jgi:DNA (cytosine-5)-methyltransferase 1
MCRKQLTVALAVDADPDVIRIYKRHVENAAVKTADIEDLFDGTVGGRPTPSERRLAAQVGAVSILLGGPPCQGQSN